MRYQGANRAFQASAGRTPLQAPRSRSPSECARCPCTYSEGRFNGVGRYQAVVGGHSLSHGTPGSQSHERHQKWQCLLSLAAVPGLKAAAGSAGSISELYIPDSSGSNGGASGNGSGPWGNGDGSSGMYPPPESEAHRACSHGNTLSAGHTPGHHCCQPTLSELGVVQGLIMVVRQVVMQWMVRRRTLCWRMSCCLMFLACTAPHAQGVCGDCWRRNRTSLRPLSASPPNLPSSASTYRPCKLPQQVREVNTLASHCTPAHGIYAHIDRCRKCT